MTTDPKSYEAQRKHVLVINSPKFPGGVMRGYVAEIDYRTLERELSRCREELEDCKGEQQAAREIIHEQRERLVEADLASHAEREGVKWDRSKGAYDIRGCWQCGAPVGEPLHYMGCSRLQEVGPVQDDYLRPAPSAVSELAEAVKKYLDEVGPESWWTAGERRLAKALRSHQAPVGEGWISVKERLPRSGSFVLMFAGEVYCACYGSNALTAPNHFSFCGSIYHPTHWMPLPPAPEKP